MKSIKRITLDELATTMPEIPESEQISFFGGETLYFNSVYQVINYFSCYSADPNWVEKAIYTMADGTYVVYTNESLNTHNYCMHNIQAGINNYAGHYYFNFKEIVAIAHTHRLSSNPSQIDYDISDATGLPCSIYYNNSFHCYANCNNY